MNYDKKRTFALLGAVVKRVHMSTERLKKEAWCIADLFLEW
jgi:hypothetical protein